MTKTKKSVTLTLAPISFVVEGNNDKELLEQAKKAMAAQLVTGKFPYITFNVDDADALTLDTVFAGQVVESHDGNVGIVVAVNKKNIKVTYTGHRTVSGPPQLFKPSTACFEEVRSKRTSYHKEAGYWDEGYSGYLKTNEGIHEVVVGKMTRGNIKLHVINTKKFLSTNENRLRLILRDERNEF